MARAPLGAAAARSAGVLIASSTGVFDGIVAVHVACAVIGFGALALNGAYGFWARRAATAGVTEEVRRYFASPARVELFVVPVPFLGVGALLAQPGGRGLGQVWAWLAALVWLVAVVVLFGVVRPAERQIRAVLLAGPAAHELPAGPAAHELLAAGPAPASELAAAGGRVGWGGVVTDVAFVVALLLMVFQPGR